MTDTDLDTVLTDWISWKSNLKNIYKGIDSTSLYASLDAEEDIAKKINQLRNAIWNQNTEKILELYEQVQLSIEQHKQDILLNILRREPHTLSLKPSSHS
jgi:hypothetical protein